MPALLVFLLWRSSAQSNPGDKGTVNLVIPQQGQGASIAIGERPRGETDPAGDPGSGSPGGGGSRDNGDGDGTGDEDDMASLSVSISLEGGDGAAVSLIETTPNSQVITVEFLLAELCVPMRHQSCTSLRFKLMWIALQHGFQDMTVACQASLLTPDGVSGSVPSGGTPSMEPPGFQSSTSPPAQPPPSKIAPSSSSPDPRTLASPQQSDNRPPSPQPPRSPPNSQRAPPPPPPPILPVISPSSLSLPDSKYHQRTCNQLSPPKDLGEWQRWSDHGIWPGGKYSGADLDIVIPCALVHALC